MMRSRVVSASGRDCGSSGSKPIITCVAVTASSTVRVSTVCVALMPARDPPPSEISPGVGFRPTMLFRAAGTRPDPAASPPTAKLTSPAPTTTPPPEVDPPEI
jgi:hypothetical protein